MTDDFKKFVEKINLLSNETLLKIDLNSLSDNEYLAWKQALLKNRIDNLHNSMLDVAKSFNKGSG